MPTTVTMIGLGNMGSALARSVLAHGHRVTVWNRTPSRADELARHGAAVAPSAPEAIAASDVVVVCVRGYDAADEIFRHPDASPHLAGRTIVQLGTGVPTEATDASAWFTDQGAAYLDGAIMTFPDAVGSPECQVLISGDPAGFERCRSVLDAIGGDIRFLGPDPAAAAVVNTSGLAFGYTASHAFLSAAAICEASGAPLDLLVEVVGRFSSQVLPPLFGEFSEMIGAGRYDSTNLRLASGADNLGAIVEYGRRVGVDTELFESARRTLVEAAESAAGVNIAAAFERLRRPPH